MLLVDCVLWKPGPNEESQDMFRNALPEGFAWELIEITSGKAAAFNLSLCVRKPTIWIPTRSDTNQPVQ